VLESTQDNEEIIERVAALDIGKAELVCCVRVPGQGPGGRRRQEVTTYSTMTRSLLTMVDRFRELGITRVVMEATSDYWKPAFYLLEAAGFDPWLVNARDVKHLPGRPKTDRLDAVWLCKVAERQMIRPSFVPPAPIRELRDLTRYRVDLIATRTAERSRVEKLLEDAQIKLSVVASDIFGLSGRDMMAALIAGQRDPKILAQMARSRLRTKITQLEEAFVGRFSDHHGFLLAKMLARVDAITADIADVDARIEQQIGPFVEAGRRSRRRHEQVPDPRPPRLVGAFRPWGQGISRQEQGHRLHRPRQPLPGPGSGRGRRRRRQDRHLPRRTLQAHRPTPRQQTRHRRRRPLHPDHRLASTRRSGNPVHRPRPRVLRHPRQPRTP
jgi:transposase